MWVKPGAHLALPALATTEFHSLVLPSKEEKHGVGPLNLLIWQDLYYSNDSCFAFTGLLYLFFFFKQYSTSYQQQHPQMKPQNIIAQLVEESILAQGTQFLQLKRNLYQQVDIILQIMYFSLFFKVDIIFQVMYFFLPVVFAMKVFCKCTIHYEEHVDVRIQ